MQSELNFFYLFRNDTLVNCICTMSFAVYAVAKRIFTLLILNASKLQSFTLRKMLGTKWIFMFRVEHLEMDYLTKTMAEKGNKIRNCISMFTFHNKSDSQWRCFFVFSLIWCDFLENKRLETEEMVYKDHFFQD